MIKVNFILGFLGAGKTTFIKSLLQNGVLKGERVVLVVNDYGPENYDSEILSVTGAEIIEITNGCLCCSNQDGFQDILESLCKREDIDRIIIEPSGLFFPDQVIPNFNKEPLISRMLLEPVFVIADMAFLSKATRAWPPFILRHIEIADYIITNKQQKISDAQSGNIKKRFKEVNGTATIRGFAEAIEEFKSQKSQSQHKFESYSKRHHEIKLEVKTDNISFKDKEDLKNYFRSQTSSLVRAKGIVLIDGRKVLVNYTQSSLEAKTASSALQPSLTCFYLYV